MIWLKKEHSRLGMGALQTVAADLAHSTRSKLPYLNADTLPRFYGFSMQRRQAAEPDVIWPKFGGL